MNRLEFSRRHVNSIVAAARISPDNLRHGLPIELVSKIKLAHISLLTSNLGKKVSTNLVAIQFDHKYAFIVLKAKLYLTFINENI